ncbi:MAG: glucuronate isomerase [Spirochaetales bacterium]|nr:glucuronate isomerase [Spirochaetales bacterium]
MKKFMCEDFLLQSTSAKKLYHHYAENMPIYDYHCHLSPREIAENKKYNNISELWLGGDHYKWRAMRSNGVEEKFITGNASNKEKFGKWAETIENSLGNPLYHWTHLELKRYFGIDDLLNTKTADMIFDKCNSLLEQDDFSSRGLIKRSNVKVIGTTDDPLDDLGYHKALASDTTFTVKVVPAFRPDKAINIESPGFIDWHSKLESLIGQKITSYPAFTKALQSRIAYFHENSCRISDHALEPPVYEPANQKELEQIFTSRLKGETLSSKQVKQFKTALMVFLGREYSRLGWVMQLHIGTLRNNNSRMYKQLGPDTGFDAIGDSLYIENLTRLLDKLDSRDELPKTILYNINPRDNEAIGTLIGCFQGNGIPGKIQFGSAWWFNDQYDGMVRHLKALSSLGLLSRFVGMLTDSRSFLSFTRHEYFRRILCDLIGQWVETGQAPDDEKMLGKMVRNICFENARNYFGINVE